MSWTTPQDILDRWVGGGAPTDTDLLSALILDAEAVVLAEYPGIQARIDNGDIAEQVVIMVVVRMVTRILRNPENLTYWQQNTGPFGQGRTFGQERDIWLTQDELNLLAPKLRGKAYEVNLGYNALNTSDDMIWFEVSN